jgi:hypothetical protein
MIRLEQGDFGTFLIVNEETGKDILIQTDWDYPGVASTFGWVPCHDSTDGTVTCPDCGKTPGELISEANEFLRENIGACVEDPGYFGGD